MLAATVWLIGCGHDVYEQRLAETVKYFEYREEVDKALAGETWSQYGIQLRVPKQFELIPPNPPEETAGTTDAGGSGLSQPGHHAETGRAQPPAGSLESPPTQPQSPDHAAVEGDAENGNGNPGEIRDPRQPDYLNLYLPGLLGAWRAPVDVVQDGEPRKATAYLYVMSNHQRWIEKNDGAPVDPFAFHDDVAFELARALQIPPPSQSVPWDWKVERVPRGQGYVEQKAFDMAEFDQEIDGLPHQLILYNYTVEDVHVSLLLVLPRGIERRQKLMDGIRHCLEWMKVSGDKPTGRPTRESTSGF